MNTDNRHNIEELLIRYCEGQVSKEEAIYVKRWINDSDENRRIARRINYICFATDAMSLEDSLDIKSALNKVQYKISIRRYKAIGKWVQRIAAMLVIPLLTLLTVQYFRDQALEPDLVAVNTHPGMSSSLTLPDGTLVYLNSASSLTYPSSFKGDTRCVSLKGEAYFEVSPNPRQKFIVSTPHHASIEVVGTHFNIDAYETDDKMSVTLLEGKVNFLFTKKNKKQLIKLNPGNKVIYNAKTNEIAMSHTAGVVEVGWTQGKIILENTPLEEALHLLGKHFHVDFVIANPRLKDYSFTGIFTNQSLERVLDKFRLSSHIRWRYFNEIQNSGKKMQIEIY